MNPFEQPPEDEERKRRHVMIRVAMNNRIYHFPHRYGSNLAAFLICFLCIFRISLLVIVNRKWENSQLHRQYLCFRRLRMYTAPYKQSAPNNSLTVHCAMSRQKPIVSGWSQLYLADLQWSTDALRHNSGLLVTCYLEAPLKGGGIQQLDRVQGHTGSDCVTHCQQGLNLKVGKKRPHLGTQDPIWAKCSKRGQNFSRMGKKKYSSIYHSAWLDALCFLQTETP